MFNDLDPQWSKPRVTTSRKFGKAVFALHNQETTMQLKLASPLEIQLYLACRANETQPAGEIQTQVAVALSEAVEELQSLRRRLALCGCGRKASDVKIWAGTNYPWCGRAECIDSDKAITETK